MLLPAAMCMGPAWLVPIASIHMQVVSAACWRACLGLLYALLCSIKIHQPSCWVWLACFWISCMPSHIRSDLPLELSCAVGTPTLLLAGLLGPASLACDCMGGQYGPCEVPSAATDGHWGACLSLGA
jgi:hypothetical protein